MTTRPVAAMAMAADLPARLFDGVGQVRLADIVELRGDVLTEFESEEARRALRSVEVLVTGWGAPRVGPAVLAAAPRLRAIVHAAGSVKGIVDPACWDRGVRVSTAAGANAKAVAEYTLAMIVLAGKDAFAASRRPEWREPQEYSSAIGNRGRVVGIVGASRVGRLVLGLLGSLDVDILLSDPYVSAAEASSLGATSTDLDEMVAGVTVLSLHAPAIPQTRHLIDRRRLALLPDGATLVNTARGALVDEAALVDELSTGRINAILDVTDPEPPRPDSPLRSLPNVVLTPHIAGSIGNEVGRLGAAALDELARYAAGQPFRDEVRAERLGTEA